MILIALLPLAMLLGAILMRSFVIRPSRTIVPLYAATLPIASAIDLPIPLPAPFNSLSSLLGAVAIISCTAHLIIYRQARIPSANAGLWVAFLGWVCLTGWWALEPASALRTMMIASSLIVLMLVVSALPLTAKDFEVIRLAVMLSGLIVGSYAVYLQATGAQFPTHGVSQRFSITSDPEQTDPNILAASLLMPLGLALEQMILGTPRWWRNWRDSRSRGLGTLAAMLTTVSILFTASRGGLVSAVVVSVGTFFYCAKAPRGRIRVKAVLRNIVASLLGVGIAIMLSTYFLPRLTARAQTRLLNPAIQRTIRAQGDPSGRAEIWQAGLIACENHCLLGVGIGNFPRIYNKVFAFSGADENVGYNRVAHNLYLSLAVETGIIGLTLFGVALVAEWARLSSQQMMTIGPSFKPLLVGLLIVNIFLSAVWFKYFWLVFTLIRAAETSVSPFVEVEIDHPLPAQVRWSAYQSGT